MVLNLNVLNQRWSMFHILLLTLISVILLAYVQFHWRRRRLYKMASKFKGPLCLPIVGSIHLFSRPSRGYEVFMKLFSEYGNGVALWLGPQFMVGLSDPDDMETVLNTCLAKTMHYQFITDVVDNGLANAPVPIWKVHRKLIMPSFSQQILEGFVRIFAEKTDTLLKKLEDVASKGEFDVFTYLTNHSVDIFCETSLGLEGDFQQSGEIYVENFKTLMENWWMRVICFHYQFDFIYKGTKAWQKLKKARSFLYKLVETAVDRRLQKLRRRKEDQVYEFEPHDKRKQVFLDSLLENTFFNKKLSLVDIRDEVITFIFAGSDTTALTNCFIFLTLGMHQHIQEKVYEEVMEVLGPNRSIEPTDLPNLKYLERVIKETLRIFPVGALILRAIEEDTKLKSFTLPAGCSALIGIRPLHLNPTIWPDPERFDPDRFLPEEVAKRHPSSFMPFSLGSRGCIGQKFAMMTLKTSIAAVVRKYKIFTGYKTIKEVEVTAEIVLRPCHGFKVSMESR